MTKISLRVHKFKNKNGNFRNDQMLLVLLLDSYVWFIHGTIIRAGTTCKKTLFSIEFGIVLNKAGLAVNKKQKYFSLPDHQLAENLILVFSFYERTK